MENELRQNRPSGDDTFVTAVNSILEAAAATDMDAVKAMLEKDPSLVQPHGDRDHGHGTVTLLHYAAQAGMVSLAGFALENGADVNARDESHGLTPLGWAVVFPTEQHEMAQLLIGRGAEQDIWTTTAMNKSDMVEELVAANPGLVHDRLSDGDWRMQPVHLAAWKGHAPVVEVHSWHATVARYSWPTARTRPRPTTSAHPSNARRKRDTPGSPSCYTSTAQPSTA